MRLLFWTGFWVFLADQASKYVVVHYLDLITKLRIDVWPPYLTFRMAWNRGVNFGIGAGFALRLVLIGAVHIAQFLVVLAVAQTCDQ